MSNTSAQADPTSKLRIAWLTFQASQWLTVVTEASSWRRFGGDEDVAKQIEIHLWGAHVVVLGLVHLRTCFDHMTTLGCQYPDGLGQLIAAYGEAFDAGRVRDCRDAMEHHEDRLAGLNVRGYRPYTGQFPRPRMTGGNAGRLRMVEVLDEEFELSSVLTAAMDLSLPFKEWAAIFARDVYRRSE